MHIAILPRMPWVYERSEAEMGTKVTLSPTDYLDVW